jgi:hypothetical protein
MIRGNFLGAAIVAIIYTIYILSNPLATRPETALVLVALNALTIVLMYFAFKDTKAR